MKKGIIVFIILATLGCNKRIVVSNTDNAPAHIQFEIERTKSPITGTVPSQNVTNLLFENKINTVKSKATKVYPNTWSSVDDQFATLSVTKIDFDPNNTNIFYFCTGEGWYNADAARGAGVWKSIDKGETWSRLEATATPDFYYCQDLIVHPQTSDIYVTTRTGGVMRSRDKGSTWQQVLGASNGALYNSGADLELTADGDVVVSIGIFSTDGMYISSTGDQGSWTKIMNGFPLGTERIEIATAKSNANVMYAIPQNGNTNKIDGVWKSVDKGQSWIEKENPGGDNEFAKVQSWYDLIIEVDPNDENIVVAGGLNIWRSKDGCDSWKQLTEGDYRKKSSLQYVHVDQHNIVFQNSDTVYFLNDGGIYKCDNFSADTPILYDVNTNYNVTQFYSCDIHPFTSKDMVIGGTQDNGTNASTDKNISPFERVSWADGGLCAIDYEDPDYVYSTTQERRVYRRHQGVVDTITNFRITNANTLFINPLVMDATDPNIIYQASNIGVWALENARTDDTAQWRQISRPMGVVSAIATSASAPNTVYFGRMQSAYRVDNVSESDNTVFPVFLDRNNELESLGYINCIVPDDLDKNHLILIYSNYDMNSVYETYNAYDNDPTWVSCEGNLPNIPVRWGCFKNGSSSVFYIATELGVYYTDKLDNSNTVWKKTNDGLPNLRMDMIKSRKSDNKMVVATHGRGIYTGETKEGTNDIVWKERGPNNIAGRTRSILIDPNISSNKKVWAGSVSGGLWVVQNIDSAAKYIDVAESSSLNVYPNPAENSLVLTFDEANTSDIIVTIFNNLGQTILKKTLPSQAQETIDISGFSNGILYVQLWQGDSKIVKKIIKTEQ